MKKYTYELTFELNQDQKHSSQQLLSNFKSNKNSLVYAVCGAGKTEIIFETIKYALINNLKVGIAIPRRELIIEIGNRIKECFKHLEVTLVYGGHNQKKDGDLIVCTTHQLYHYHNYFDLLIIDEIDAFPFIDNSDLNKDAALASKQFIYLSATPSKELLKQVKNQQLELITIYKRCHGFELPPFITKYVSNHNKNKILIEYTKKIISENRSLIIFVPFKAQIGQLSKLLNHHGINHLAIASTSDNKEMIMNKFKNEKTVIISTTLLERGITKAYLDVIVYDAHSTIFDEKTLIQINGRVGRKFDDPTGKVILLTMYKTMGINGAKNTLKKIQKYAFAY